MRDRFRPCLLGLLQVQQLLELLLRLLSRFGLGCQRCFDLVEPNLGGGAPVTGGLSPCFLRLGRGKVSWRAIWVATGRTLTIRVPARPGLITILQRPQRRGLLLRLCKVRRARVLRREDLGLLSWLVEGIIFI